MHAARKLMNDHVLIRLASAGYRRWLPKDCAEEHDGRRMARLILERHLSIDRGADRVGRFAAMASAMASSSFCLASAWRWEIVSRQNFNGHLALGALRCPGCYGDPGYLSTRAKGIGDHYHDDEWNLTAACLSKTLT
jgi:hypothetical protein